MRGYRAVTAVIAATVIVAAGTHLGGQNSGPGRVGTGAASGQRYIATTGTDSGNCATSGTACLTPAYAWGQASSGDTINVANGDYTSGCALTGTKASDTTFVGTTSARFVCSVSLPAGNVHAVFDGLSIYQISTSVGASFVTVKNGAITCTDSAPYTLYTPDSKCNARFSISGSAASNWTFLNETIGPEYDSENCGNSGNTNLINVQVTHLSFTNVTWRDSRYADCVARGQSQQHTENFYFAAPSGGTSSDITFDRCTVTNGAASGKINAGTGVADGTGPDSTGIMLTATGGSVGTFSAFTMSNCLFFGNGASVEGNVDAQFTTGSVIEYSTFTGGISTFECSVGNCPSGYTDLTLKGNVIITTGGGCPDGGTLGVKYVYNVDVKPLFNSGSPSKCGSNDLTLTNPDGSTDIRSQLFTTWTGSNLTSVFSLASGSQAASFVPVAQGGPSDDYTGAARPNAAHPTTYNAGAYENR